MNIPENYKYTKTHEWVCMTESGTVRVGITDFAQQELGDLVFVNVPEVGDSFNAGDVFADVESVKTAEDIYAPVGGVVRAVNTELADSPELVNENAFEAWFAEFDEVAEGEELMTAAEYEKFLAEA